jgi:hypothetical protein
VADREFLELRLAHQVAADLHVVGLSATLAPPKSVESYETVVAHFRRCSGTDQLTNPCG